jgi:putrescine transport system permease protein
VKPDVNAMATILIALVTVGTIIAGIVSQKRERRRLLDEQLAFDEIAILATPAGA